MNSRQIKRGMVRINWIKYRKTLDMCQGESQKSGCKKFEALAPGRVRASGHPPVRVSHQRGKSMKGTQHIIKLCFQHFCLVVGIVSVVGIPQTLPQHLRTRTRAGDVEPSGPVTQKRGTATGSTQSSAVTCRRYSPKGTRHGVPIRAFAERRSNVPVSQGSHA